MQENNQVKARIERLGNENFDLQSEIMQSKNEFKQKEVKCKTIFLALKPDYDRA